MKDMPCLDLAPNEFELLAALCKLDPQFPASWQAWNDQFGAPTQEGANAGSAQPAVHLHPHHFGMWCTRIGISPCLDAIRAYSIIHCSLGSTARYGATELDSRSPEFGGG